MMRQPKTQISIDQKLIGSDGRSTGAVDFMCAATPDPSAYLEEEDRDRIIGVILHTLQNLEGPKREIIHRLYLDPKPADRADVAASLNMTPEQLALMEQAALVELRQSFGECRLPARPAPMPPRPEPRRNPKFLPG